MNLIKITVSIILAAAVGQAACQTFRSSDGNEYAGKSAGGKRENGCVEEIIIDRKVSVTRDETTNKLIFMMELNRQRSAAYRGQNYRAETECDAGFESSSATVRFFIRNEAAKFTTYSGTVIAATPSATGFKLGDRIAGTIEVFDGGRALDFNNEEFIEGTARVLAIAFKNAAGNEAAYFLPNRAPDISLSCKVVASDGSSNFSTSKNSGSYSSSTGSSVSGSSESSSATTSATCLGYGWEKIRKTVSIWLNEKRCEGYPCEISQNTFKWSKGSVSRASGQMKDACYTYECDKTTTQNRF